MSQGQTRTVLLIAGMRDNSCREAIAALLAGIRGVRDVSVSLLRAQAIVTHAPPCDGAELVRVVRGAGYGATLQEGGASPGPGPQGTGPPARRSG